MKALSISRAWDETREIVQRDGKLLAAIVAALILLPTALANLVNPSLPSGAMEPRAGNSLLELLLGLVMQAGTLAVTAVALKPGTSVGQAISTGLRKLFPALAALLLFILPILFVLGMIVGVSLGEDGAANLEARLAAGDVPGSVVWSLLIGLLLLVFLTIRFMLAGPVAVAESNNPLTILKRSWALTSGHFWRLLGYIVMLGLAAVLAMLAISFVFGGIIIAMLGDPEPMTVSALLLGLVMGIANAAFVLVFALMSARIYAQLAAGNVTVPDVERQS